MTRPPLTYCSARDWRVTAIIVDDTPLPLTSQRVIGLWMDGERPVALECLVPKPGARRIVHIDPETGEPITELRGGTIRVWGLRRRGQGRGGGVILNGVAG